MTKKTTYKVGDKVRILDAGAISTCAAKDGDILEVVSIDRSNDPVLLDVDEGHLSLFTSELKYIEKVAEQVAKFKVGDKVRVTNAQGSKHRNGDEGIIVSITPMWDVVFYDVDVNGMQQGHYDKDIELISPKPTKNQRITALEKTVADLQTEVEALKAAQKLPTMTVKADIDIAKIAESLAKAIGKRTEPSPNEQRKAIIAEAKAFVKNTEQRAGAQFYKAQGDSTKRMLSFKYEVNTEKRTVVALGFGSRSITLRGKGIAKCAPDDVFNADIGKAIALGRALGLDVSKFEKAVQPSEPAVGMKAEIEGNCYPYVETINEKGTGDRHSMTAVTRSEDNTLIRILDDTEAQY